MPLPIESAIPALRRALRARDEAILVAAPGAGKTTWVPLALLTEEWLGGQRILMLEPRRLAAKNAAARMAHLLDEDVGETVGYRMRLEQRESARTRILVVTEGVLARMLQSDPSLDGVGLVIFDEFHERSLDADLGLALTLYARPLLRETPPLKLLVMSATLDSDALAAMLYDAPVVRSEGRSYPVAVRHEPTVELRDIGGEVADRICRSLQRDEGSLLAFLPGHAEIRAAERVLADRLDDDVIVAPLYGDLSLDQQQRAIAPPPDGRRKVVLATTLAESSITIEGVSVVIDSGFTRVPRFDPRTGMTRLHTVRVSQAGAAQRAGRAGRLGPGIAYRLWPEDYHRQLPAYGEPEIRHADLAPAAMQLLHWGVTPDELQWLDAPAAGPWQQALEVLQFLQACECRDGRRQLTAHGEAMASLPVHPRLAHMLLKAAELELSTLACDIAALLSERDPAPGSGGDLARRLALLRGERRDGQLQRLRRQSQRFRRLLRDRAQSERDTGPGHASPDRAGLLLALAYPDRVARQRSAGAALYTLANGRSAAVADDDPLRNEPWLAVAQLGGREGQSVDRIFIAARLDPDWLHDELAGMVQSSDVLEWENDQLVAQRRWMLGKLVVRRETLRDVDEARRRQAVVDLLRRGGLGVLPWTESLQQWRARIACLREYELAEKGESEWPDLGDDWLTEHLDAWLGPFVGAVTHRRQLRQLDLAGALQSLLPWPLPRRLDELAPTHYTVPTGSRIRIDYAQRPPVLAVKLQEMFGQTSAPSIAGGRIPLMLHLLSPAGRPLAVTRDLASFWNNAYREVRKDMKGRYPKHPWPEDPLNAEPVRGTRKRPG